MRIIRITDQIRRDFWADMECEGCGHIKSHVSGYDDRYFHDQVIPDMKCPACGESRNSLGIVQERPTRTRYAEWEVV